MENYTHLAEIYGVRCWYNDRTYEVKGTNWFNSRMIDFFLWIDVTFGVNDGFYIKVIEEL